MEQMEKEYEMINKTKTPVWMIIAYCFVGVKFISTLLIPFTQGLTMYFSNVSALTLLVLQSDQISLTCRMIALIAILITWIVIFVTSILGIKIKGARLFVYVCSIILATFDCVIPMIFAELDMKIVCLCFSLVVIFVNAMEIVKQKG